VTSIDLLPIVLIIVYGVLGFFTGVVRRGIGLVALFIGFLAATGMALQAATLLQQSTSLDTPGARIVGFFGILLVVLVAIDGAAQLANSQIQIEAVVWNRASGVAVGILTALLLSVVVVFEADAAGNPSGSSEIISVQADLHNSVKDSAFAVPIMRAVYRPIVAIFQPVLPADPHQYFSHGPAS
jgi:uncharacterized membrane protein required for colicin V production